MIKKNILYSKRIFRDINYFSKNVKSKRQVSRLQFEPKSHQPQYQQQQYIWNFVYSYRFWNKSAKKNLTILLNIYKFTISLTGSQTFWKNNLQFDSGWHINLSKILNFFFAFSYFECLEWGEIFKHDFFLIVGKKCNSIEWREKFFNIFFLW